MTPSDDATETPLRARKSDWLTPARADAQPEPRLLTRDDISVHRPTTASPRRHRALRWISRIVLCLIILVAALAVITAIWMRRSMRAALPQIDGTLTVSGLQSPVTVTRDPRGVPSIQASSVDDLLFAQGFVTAQDRLWQMDTLRRHAAGELAEILGPSLVKHDKQQRYLRLRAAADRAVQSLPPDQLHEFEAYARGVNAFIDSHRDRLPLEFRLLHYTPRAWTPRDSVLVALVMWQDLATTFPEKLDRESLARHLPPSLLPDLYPVGSWRDHPPTQPPADLSTPREIEQIPLDRSQSRLTRPDAFPSPHDLLAVTDALSSSSCKVCRAGSNNWAVSGVRSAAGMPLVSNDMHLGLRVPDIWYEAALHLKGSTAIDVEGFTLPGLPWVLAGRNAHVAWGLTNLGGDVQDVRIEHLRGSGSNLQFEQPDGTWSPVEHHAEHIVVRGGHDVSLDVLTVSHAAGATMVPNPIISPLYCTEHRALSLAWTVYDPSTISAPFYAVDAATDGASLVASFATFGGPSLNLVYGDDQGHIGYHAIGRIPIRGPAIQHPRAAQPVVIPPPEPDSDDDDSDNNDASGKPITFSAQAAQPHLLRVTTRRRSRRAHPRPPQQNSEKTSQPASSTTQQLAPEPAATDYTIGSPISPLPVDSLDTSQIWSGYVPYNELPAIQDPASGIVATANARITPDDYPYALANEWADPYRVERIYRELGAHDGWTPQQMLALETDQHSEFDLALAQRLAYAIDHSSDRARGNDTVRLRQAADLLRTWRGQMSASSPAAAIVGAAHHDLWTALLVPQILAHDGGSRSDALAAAHLYVWAESSTALENIVTNAPARWLPPGTANWNDFLTGVVESALHDAHAPHDLAKWQYGAIHHIAIEHPLFNGRKIFQWLLGGPTGSGTQPIGGDATTIDATGAAFGPSERFTADLSSPAATIANIVTGESGNPASPWYLDQLQPWLQGTSFALPLEGFRADHTLLLVPGR